MLFNLILFIGTYPIIIILYFVVKAGSKNQNGIFFGLCVPKDEILAEEFAKKVKEKQEWYLKRMRKTLIILLIIPLISFFVPYISIQFTIWMTWLLLAIFCLEVPFALVNRDLKVWKKSVHAQAEDEAKNTRLFELSEAGQVRKTKLVLFLPPIAISIAAIAAYYFLCEDINEWRRLVWIVVVFALSTPIFYFAAGWMDRQRTAVVSHDSEINLNYARAKKQIWNRFWLFGAWLNAVFTVFSAFALAKGRTTAVLLWGTIAYMLLLMLSLLAAVKQVGRVEQRYEKKIDPFLKEEDDDCWIGGIVYYNKADRRTFVEPRFGYGTTTNMATPVGKGLIAAGVLALLSLPIVCIWMILLEFTPIHLDIQQGCLIAKHLKTDYEIDICDISELELVDNLPKLSKNSGTGMDTLYKGNWHILYAGDCEVFLNPQNEVFLKFMSDGVLYYMSASENEQTRAVYQELVTAMGN